MSVSFSLHPTYTRCVVVSWQRRCTRAQYRTSRLQTAIIVARLLLNHRHIYLICCGNFADTRVLIYYQPVPYYYGNLHNSRDLTRVVSQQKIRFRVYGNWKPFTCFPGEPKLLRCNYQDYGPMSGWWYTTREGEQAENVGTEITPGKELQSLAEGSPTWNPYISYLA